MGILGRDKIQFYLNGLKALVQIRGYLEDAERGIAQADAGAFGRASESLRRAKRELGVLNGQVAPPADVKEDQRALSSEELPLPHGEVKAELNGASASEKSSLLRIEGPMKLVASEDPHTYRESLYA